MRSVREEGVKFLETFIPAAARKAGLLMLILGLAAAACAPIGSPQPETPAAVIIEPTRLTQDQDDFSELEFPQEPQFGYTFHRPDGNRLVAGRGSIPDAEPIRLELGFTPAWIVAAAAPSGSVWSAVSSEAEAAAFLIMDGSVRKIPIGLDDYQPGAPPLLRLDGGGASLQAAPRLSSAAKTHPAVLDGDGAIVWIGADGALNLQVGEEQAQLDVVALPDARMLQDGDGRILLLSDPTQAYDHGVLGDNIEAGAVLLVETTPEFRVVEEIRMPDGLVIEGIMPLWVDLDGDGEREIIVTASDRSAGARLLVYSEGGELLAESEAIGQGYRWRHQIAVSQSEDGAAAEIVSVRTPHIGGLLEYFQVNGSRLELVATVEGVTSHVIGTRNLDLALVGDFDSDGIAEVLLPDVDLRKLVAVERSGESAQIDWSLPLGARMSSNLAAVTDARDKISVGAGLADGSLLIWSE